MFSPYYAWRGRRDPYNHCALNVAVYAENRKLWTMTERPTGSSTVSPDGMQVGASRFTWDGDALVIAVDEVAVPLPRRVKGTVRLIPASVQQQRFMLDGGARHLWWPVAPHARIEVALTEPRLRWSGSGYLDSNRGAEPLDAAFSCWQWSRAHTRRGALVHYGAMERSGGERTHVLMFSEAGCSVADIGPMTDLSATGWRMSRRMHSDIGRAPRLVRTLEDSPFYARSLMQTTLDGQDALAVHESLSLDRFASPIVKCMLPFRMPRRRWRS